MSHSNGKFTESHWEDLRDKSVRELKKVKPITAGQLQYWEAMEKSVVTICDGPCGTGKTYLAVAKGLELLNSNKVKKLLLVRPLVNCGSGIGHLPGDKMEKIGTFLRQLLDAVAEMVGTAELRRMQEKGQIEISTLDDMRGLSLRSVFMCLDEAANAQYHQIRMWITRMGADSKAVICGDCEQSDLNMREEDNPFAKVWDRLEGIDPNISTIELGYEDVVRHPLIAKIDKALSGRI